MIQEANITSGIFFYDDGKLVGEMYILELGGVRQFHARNYGASAIRTYRRAVRFLEYQGPVVSGCEESNAKTIKFLKLLGFKYWGNKDGKIIFSKEAA